MKSSQCCGTCRAYDEGQYAHENATALDGDKKGQCRLYPPQVSFIPAPSLVRGQPPKQIRMSDFPVVLAMDKGCCQYQPAAEDIDA